MRIVEKPMQNVFDDIPDKVPLEIFQDILVTDKLTIERIISKGQTSPDTGWYDQEENEWVVVLQGHAKLRFEQDNQLVELTSGSFINIKAHTKHKVEWTCPDQHTIWLAIFYN
jgi:cupin 2 domain-containing protein